MVAYFRKENFLFSILGSVLGLVIGVLFFDQLTAGVPGYFKLFFLLLPLFIGVVAGRVYASFWANKKLREYNTLLYGKAEPEAFLKAFTPLVQKAPKDNIAYVDGSNKLAYAWEALGDFEKARNCLEALDPEQLKNHSLGGTATTCSNLVRILLLQENAEEAKAAMENLRNVASVALVRAPTLGRNAQECIRLYENWLLVLEGQPADETYLLEEIQLSKNRIHKSEIQLLLAQAYENRGEELEAQELRLDVLTSGAGLWTEKKARELLGTV